MGFFRRGESLHERLAREGGLTGPPPHDTQPRWGETGIHGVARPREWDAVATVEAPDLAGDSLEFVSLPDGSLLLDDELDADAISPLADALEQSLRPPYRAEAVRRDASTWAVAARKVEVVELPDNLDGDELVVSSADGETTLTVDGEPGFGSVPELERLGAARHESYVVRARRLDAGLFEVSVSPL
jgi:hypothetical protein